MLEVNSSSENSGESFELMAYEAEQDIENGKGEPKSPSQFYITDLSP